MTRGLSGESAEKAHNLGSSSADGSARTRSASVYAGFNDGGSAGIGTSEPGPRVRTTSVYVSSNLLLSIIDPFLGFVFRLCLSLASVELRWWVGGVVWSYGC